jgi:hypothetical protein
VASETVVAVGSLVVAALAVVASAGTVIFSSRATARLEAEKWFREQLRDLYIDTISWLRLMQEWEIGRLRHLTGFINPYIALGATTIPGMTMPPEVIAGLHPEWVGDFPPVGDPPVLPPELRDRIELLSPALDQRITQITSLAEAARSGQPEHGTAWATLVRGADLWAKIEDAKNLMRDRLGAQAE